MPTVTASLVAVALCLLNLLLTLGVIRRVREHSTRLEGLSLGSSPCGNGDVMAGAGEVVGEFAAIASDGQPVDRRLLDGDTLVGFFTPGCSACAERLPEFVAHAGTVAGGRRNVLAVVAGEGAETAEYQNLLAPAARVVVEPPEGPLNTAFQVRGYPAFAVVAADGTVRASGYDVANLTIPAAA